MITPTIDDIDEGVLRRLIDEPILEGKSLEYKLGYVQFTDFFLKFRTNILNGSVLLLFNSICN